MKYNIIKITCTGLCLLLSLSSFGQDLMARQAPIDRQLRAVDSVSLIRTFHQEENAMVNNLYSTWTNQYVDAYGKEQKPMYFKIDLRNFSMPIPSRVVTSNFGYRHRFRRNHYGLDIKLYTGDTVVSAFDGKVRIVSYDRRGYGYYVVIRHPNGLETVYGHLSKQLVQENQIVKSGEPIGLGGNTGHSFGSHLHFETRILGEAIDPSLLFDFERQDVTSDYYVYHNSRGYVDREIANIPEVNNEVIASTSNKDNTSIVEKEKPLYHKVKSGESLYSIARSNGLTVKQMCRINGLSSRSHLRVGQILKCR